MTSTTKELLTILALASYGVGAYILFVLGMIIYQGYTNV